ncbi:MAG: hypothetical protein K0R54_5062, partial [Clostridiaceae bacterium]|nr:hypothetical protein [Clostridiaceae bacterium]
MNIDHILRIPIAVTMVIFIIVVVYSHMRR